MFLSQGADCVIGAQWGSEGKGKVAAHLATLHAYSAMGRSGGPNAGHRVELPDGKFFVFRHLPSATPYAKPGTKLCIGPGAVVELEVLERELPHVPAGVELVIDPRAVIVTDRARQMEREHCLTEIGSTMSGTGGAAALRVMRTGVTFEQLAARATGNENLVLLAEILEKVSIRPVGIELRRAACRGRILLESTQGIQLSLFSGEYPKVTSRDVSAAGLLSELGLPPDFPSQRWYLVARTYPIRVAGPSGNLPGETEWEKVAETSGRDADDLRAKERTSVTNRLRRVAEWVPGSLVRTVRRNFASNGRLVVAITFADYLEKDPAALAAILREAKQCSPYHVLVGYGPKTSDVRYET
jgi:adenylosuccinate synthase